MCRYQDGGHDHTDLTRHKDGSGETNEAGNNTHDNKRSDRANQHHPLVVVHRENSPNKERLVADLHAQDHGERLEEAGQPGLLARRSLLALDLILTLSVRPSRSVPRGYSSFPSYSPFREYLR